MSRVETILISIIASLIASIIFAIIGFCFKPIKQQITKIFGRDLGVKYFYNRKRNKIYIFPKKEEIRVSVSVLAKIEQDGKYLLKTKQVKSDRQDGAYKPLGGVIKISPNIEQELKKRDGFRYDQNSRYSSKGKDFRIFIKLGNNKKIHKAIHSEWLNYYQDQLIREIREEINNISEKEVRSIFEFNSEQPISIQPHYTEPGFSVLHCHDYVHHIVFEMKVINKKLLNEIISNNKRLKWVSLKGKENKTITAHILGETNSFQKIKQKNNKT